MRVQSLSYGPLLVGIVGATVLVFIDPVSRFIEQGLAALEISAAVVILAFVLVLVAMLLHQRMRQAERDSQARRNMEAIAGEVRRAEERARELEQLVRLSEALGAKLDFKAIHQVVTQHLQLVVGRRHVWMQVRTEGWRLAVGGTDASSGSPDGAFDPGHQPGAWDTFPMFAGDKLVGLMSVGQTVGDRPQPLTDRQRKLLETAASLVGLSIRNAELHRTVTELSAIDVLTGCLARQHGMDRIAAELQRAQRSEQPVSLLFIDLDHFKQLNDRYGHLFGDTVLSAMGAAMKEALRGSDLQCRYGGEEFVVLLPDTPLDGAKRVAESMRRHLARKAIKRAEGAVFVTASVGVSAAVPGELDAKALLARADAAMYRAKRDGRNCVRVWEDYPEWQRAQTREAPSAIETNGVDEPRSAPRRPPQWRVLTDGQAPESPSGPFAVDDSKEWSDV